MPIYCPEAFAKYMQSCIFYMVSLDPSHKCFYRISKLDMSMPCCQHCHAFNLYANVPVQYFSLV